MMRMIIGPTHVLLGVPDTRCFGPLSREPQLPLRLDGYLDISSYRMIPRKEPLPAPITFLRLLYEVLF